MQVVRPCAYLGFSYAPARPAGSRLALLDTVNPFELGSCGADSHSKCEVTAVTTTSLRL